MRVQDFKVIVQGVSLVITFTTAALFIAAQAEITC